MPKVVDSMPEGKGKKGKGPTKALTPMKVLEQVEEVVAERPILYPQITLALFCAGSEAAKLVKGGSISVAQGKDLLGWETEKDYIARVMEASPELKEEEVGFGNDFILKDQDGQKVRCWNNAIYSKEGKLLATNRPFDESHCLKLAQSVLKRQWAGPTAMPGETVNGEAIIIGRTGQVESGQHRLIGLVLAGQLWAGERQGKKWQQIWATEPVLESVVVFGISESPKVLKTLDNVKARTLSDVFYTSPLFNDLAPVERKECSRMLGRAVEKLWNRVGAGKDGNMEVYRTHSEGIAFVERHPKLLECIAHLFECNKERVISEMKLSPGECSALLYLMGSSASDIDDYRTADVPSEKNLLWDNWEAAKQFWTDISKDVEEVKPIRYAIGGLVDEDAGTGGRGIEKLTILSKAWEQYLTGEPLTEDSLRLHYEEKDGKQRLIDSSNFGGIDLGGAPEIIEGAEIDPSPEEKAQAEEAIRRQHREEVEEKLRQAKKGTIVPPLPRDPTYAEIKAARTAEAAKADEELEEAKEAIKPKAEAAQKGPGPRTTSGAKIKGTK